MQADAGRTVQVDARIYRPAGAARAPQSAHAGVPRVRAAAVSHAYLYDPSSWSMTRARLLQRSRALIIGAAVLALAVLGGVLIALLGSGGPARPSPRHIQIPLHQLGTCHSGLQCSNSDAPRFFSPSSVWNAPLPADAPFDPNSSAVVANLLHQEVTESLGIATTSYGVPIYTVSENQPLVHITLDQGPAQADLQNAFDAVPLPANAKPAAGTDGNLAVYQPSTNTMWEFWRLSKQADGWHAQWGGRMPNVSNNPGYYQNVVSPSGTVLERASWGTTAASFPLVAGVMTIAELRSGVIPHALGLAITNTCGGVWAWPAQRTDGVTPEPCVPEGAHFRLDPNLNLASLHLGHFALMMAQAAQTYGIIINNRSDGFTFRGEDPTQYEAEYGYNPYNGPDGQLGSPGALFDQWPSQILEQFPWSHLELLQMDLRTQPNTTPVTEASASG